ncbi:MAG TPA: hypothetical protein DCE44_06110 [Verrucomicrobiales bacterium]|nr:hypothetical protein [Verrucomicrobiales bacterium]
MKSDPRIDTYIAKAAPFARPILKRLRQLVRDACPEAEETMRWSRPAFVLDGKLLCGMAAFKAHCNFGFWHHRMDSILGQDARRDPAAAGLTGRITRSDDLPDDQTVMRYVRTAARLNASGAPARPRLARRSRKELAVPADLAAALQKDRAATAAFTKFSPSHRREYIEWITEAKREETRQKRLATSLQWLAEGKPRHWKYMNG